MSNTPNLGVGLMATNTLQKELVFNEAMIAYDALLGGSVIDSALNTPPSSPAQGDLYIVGPSPNGAWSGKANALTFYFNGWRFITAPNHYRIWNQAAGSYYLRQSDGSWSAAEAADLDLPPWTIYTKTADFTLVSASAQSTILFDKASAIACTVPTNAAVAYPNGTEIEIGQVGDGQLTVVAAGGVTITSANDLTFAKNQYGRLRKIATNVWSLSKWQGSAPLQVPTGGTEGQVLVKGAGSTYGWGTIASPLPGGGTANQHLAIDSDGDGLVWVTPASGGGSGVPSGGTTGQVLRKASNTDGDVSWVTLTGLPAGGGGGVEEAPADGVQYARKDNGWVPVSGGGGGGGGGIEEAPEDGSGYVRQDGAWVEQAGIPTVPRTFKKYRMTLTGTGGELLVSEIVFTDPNGTSHTPASITASNGADAPNMIDGAYNTFWYGNSGAIFVATFADPVGMATIKLSQANGQDYKQTASVTVDASDDGTTWTNLVTNAPTTWAPEAGHGNVTTFEANSGSLDALFVPYGGNTGDVLSKQDDGVEWVPPTPGGLTYLAARAFRYWKIVIYRSDNPANDTQIGEVGLQNGGSAPIQMPTFVRTGNMPVEATDFVDNNETGTTGPGTAILDFTLPQRFTHLRWRSANGSFGGSFGLLADIAGSDDGTTWVPIQTGLAPAFSGFRQDKFFALPQTIVQSVLGLEADDLTPGSILVVNADGDGLVLGELPGAITRQKKFSSYRLVFTSVNGNYAACMNEVRAYDSDNNLIPIGGIVASNNYGGNPGSYSPDKAADSNNSTFWHASSGGTNTDYLEIIFTEPEAVKTILLYVEGQGDTQRPLTVTITASPDFGVTYEPVASPGLTIPWTGGGPRQANIVLTDAAEVIDVGSLLSGGSTGQVLAKVSSDAYDFEWQTPATGASPAIVQKSPGIRVNATSGTLVLPASPTTGHWLLVLATGFAGGTPAVTGFDLAGVSKFGNQGNFAFVRQSDGSEINIGVSNTDRFSYVAYEIDNISRFAMDGNTLLANSPYTQFVFPPLVAGAITFFMFEHDTTGAVTIASPPAGFTVDYTNAGADGQNHQGLIAHASPTFKGKISVAFSGITDPIMSTVTIG